MTSTTKKVIPIYTAEAFLVPVKHLSSQEIDKAHKRFTYHYYEDSKCRRCENVSERHNDICDSCVAFKGIRQTSKIVVKNDKSFLSMPIGNSKMVKKWLVATGNDDNFKLVDRHPEPIPFSRPIKLTREIYDYQKEAVKVMFKKKRGVLDSAPRTGKCVDGETLVYTNSGVKPIASLFAGFDLPSNKEFQSKVPKGMDLSIQTSSGLKEVSHLYSKVVDSTVKIRTSRGRHLRGTPNHPIQVVRGGEFCWVPMSDLQLGDFTVITKSKNNWCGNSTRLLCGDERVLSRVYQHSSNIRIGRTPKTLTKELAQVMGFLTADGRLGNHPSISFCNSSPEKRNKFASAWNKCFPDNPLKETVDETRTPGLHTSCAYIRFFLEEACGFKLENAGKKRFPKIMFLAPRAIVLNYLAAYMSCDGEITESGAMFSTASFLMAHDHQEVLTALGYSFRFNPKPRKIKLKHKTVGERVGLYGSVRCKRSELNTLINELPFFLRNDMPKSESRSLDQFDKIPFLRSILRDITSNRRVRNGQKFFWKTDSGLVPFRTLGRILKDKRGNGRSPHLNRAVVNSIGSTHKVVSMDALERISSKGDFEKVKRLIDPNFTYEEIVFKKTENKPSRVYDVCVPGPHSFFGNGIVVHNTVMGTALMCKLGVKTLIIGSQLEWLKQFQDTFFGTETQLGFTNAKPRQAKICSTLKDFQNTDIALCTFSRFMSKSGQALLEEIRELFNLVLVDEVHYTAALQTSRILSRFNAEYMIGLSGTVERKVSEEIQIVHDLVGPIIHTCKVERMRATLVPFFPKVKIADPKGGGQSGFTYFQTRLESNSTRRQILVKEIIRLAKQGHLVLVPLSRVESILKWTQEINAEAERPGFALPFFGGMPKNKRAEVVQMAREYRCRVLVGNIALLSTGLNIPRASCIIEGTATSNIPKATQRLSRILTPMDDKPAPIIILVLDESDMMMKMRRNEFWNAIKPRFDPVITREHMGAILGYFSGKGGGSTMQYNLKEGM